MWWDNERQTVGKRDEVAPFFEANVAIFCCRKSLKMKMLYSGKYFFSLAVSVKTTHLCHASERKAESEMLKRGDR